MHEGGVTPVRLTGLAALSCACHFAFDPLAAMRRSFDAFGPFVILAEAFPLLSRMVPRSRLVLLGTPLIFATGAELYRELLSDPESWHGVSLLPGGPKNSAAQRVGQGLTSMTGRQHEHYRKLIVPRLRKTRIHVFTARMAHLAQLEVASWPEGQAIDLRHHVARLAQHLALELLFGGQNDRSRSIAHLVSRLMGAKWGWSAFVPINLPFTTYGRIARECALLERLVLEWAADKRGQLDDTDLASIIVNSPDCNGTVPDETTIAGQLSTLVVTASEATQAVLCWALLLLAQHPQIARELRHELQSVLHAGESSLARVTGLLYLDAVVREAMRILPPVPIQVRVAARNTAIAGHDVPIGTHVMLNTFLTNRMSDLYPEGDLFRPERWFTIAPSPFEFPVFGAGAHICPGYSFALNFLKVALAAILIRFRVTLAPGVRVNYSVQPTLRPLSRLPVCLHRQDGPMAATSLRGSVMRLVRFPPK